MDTWFWMLIIFFLVVIYGQSETRELYLITKMICLCIFSPQAAMNKLQQISFLPMVEFVHVGIDKPQF